MSLSCVGDSVAHAVDYASDGGLADEKPRCLQIVATECPQGFQQSFTAASGGSLLYVAAGMVLVTVGDDLWPLLPQRAFWIPPHMSCEIGCRSDAMLYTLQVDRNADDHNVVLPQRPTVIDVSPLFRELILEAIRLSNGGGSAAGWAWIEPLILSRIVENADDHGKMRAPRDPRLLRICNEIVSNPSDNRTIDDWAAEVAMSRRTLTRRFRDETGLSFSMWRQQARLQEAIARLKLGQPITTIAFDIGYESPASFSNVFRQTFGTSPSRFLGNS